MSTNDPAQERQRLVEHYAGLPDESLLQLADDRESLTDIAREMLAAEISRRQLSAAKPEPEAESTRETVAEVSGVDRDGLVTISQFRDLPEALFAKGALDSADIECWVLDANLVRLDWFISNGIGGIKLKVRPEDVEAASEILNRDIPENFDIEGIGSYEQPHCPKCGSVNITFEALNKPLSYGSAYLGVPIPFPRNVWKCETCGQHWKEVEDEVGESQP